MKKFREPANREQLALLPRSVEEYVGEGDIVRYVDIIVDEFDVSRIESAYSELGRKAYHPRVLLKVLFYGKFRGIRSSRELARACRENLSFMFLAGHEAPDFRTISEFRRKHRDELSGLLKQSIKIGLEQGLISLNHVAIDGTKIRAFSSKKSFRTPEELKMLLKRVDEQLERSILEDICQDTEEDKRYGEKDYDTMLPGELRSKQALREKVKAAVREYDSTYCDKKRPKQVSLTDPESRFIRSEGVVPCYNCLAAVDEDSKMVVAGYATNAVSDNAELTPCLEAIEANTGANPKRITADKGFRAHAGLVELKRRNIDGYVPPPNESKKKFTRENFKYSKKADEYICPNGRVLKKTSTRQDKTLTYTQYAATDCSTCSLKSQCLGQSKGNKCIHVSTHYAVVDEMRRKVAAPIGKAMAKKRAATVESVFGNIKGNKKLRKFLFRGMNMINAMWLFELAAHNLEKLAKAAQRNQLQFIKT